ncbi:MAG: HD domain-containing protein [Chloroflexi bacterium]|nr:HD domain-containing protein [Chloroflexota bacterium]
MTLQPLDTSIRTLVQQVASALPPGDPAYAVGGFLRDALLGRTSYDLDIAVAGDALAIARRLADALGGAFVPLDEERQVARIAFHHQGQPWHIDVAALQGDLSQDLARRDFTINAMAVPLAALLSDTWAAHVVDPHGGREDLQRKLVRWVSESVFQEDGIRLLRAVRIAARLGFQIDPATAEGIRHDAPWLDGVAGERQRDELLAVLACQGAMAHLYVMDSLDLLCRVFPELGEGKGVSQPKEHHWDVFHHNVETVGAAEGILLHSFQPAWVLDHVPWDDSLAAYFGETAAEGHSRATLLKLAALLHDIAKPETKTLEPSGRIRFFGHHTLGAEMTRGALHRLRLSRRGAVMVAGMVEHHLRPGQMSQGMDLPTAKAIYRYFRDVGEVALDTLYLNLSDYLSARGPMLEQAEWEAYTRIIRHILETGDRRERSAVVRLVDGHELMDALALSPGPNLGRLLEAVQEAQATGEITNKEEALAFAQQLLASSPEAHYA